MNCKNCNNPISVDTKFCEKCGQMVNSETIPVNEQKTGKNPVLKIIISVVVLILAFGIGFYLIQGALSLAKNNTNSEDLISNTVKQVKASITFPFKVDDVTSLVDITAEKNAVRYHNVLSGVDTNVLSNESLKKYILPVICQNKDTKNLLDLGINMEYSYTVKNMTNSYYITFSKVDCL